MCITDQDINLFCMSKNQINSILFCIFRGYTAIKCLWIFFKKINFYKCACLKTLNSQYVLINQKLYLSCFNLQLNFFFYSKIKSETTKDGASIIQFFSMHFIMSYLIV